MYKIQLTPEQIDAQRKEKWDREQAAKKKETGNVAAMRIVDIDIPFGSLVWFMAKVGLASIPAAMLLGLALVTLRVFFFGF